MNVIKSVMNIMFILFEYKIGYSEKSHFINFKQVFSMTVYDFMIYFICYLFKLYIYIYFYLKSDLSNTQKIIHKIMMRDLCLKAGIT